MIADDSENVLHRPLIEGCDTLLQLFERVLSEFGEAEAIVERGDRVTFAQWWQRAGGVARALHDIGIRRGEVVAALLPTSIDYAILYLAAVRLGAVMTGLNPRLGPNEVGAICARTQPAAIVLDESAAHLIPSGYGGPRLSRPDMVANFGAPAPAPPSVSSDDPVAIVWTSGTTGMPKGAWYDHLGLRGAAECAAELTARYDRRLVPVPFMHAGFMTKVWDLAAFANTVVISPAPWAAPSMLEQMVSERITVAVGVPTQWSKLLELPELDTADLSSLRVAVTSTAPASPELVRAIRDRLKCDVLVRYATTETGVGTGTRMSDPPDVVFETVGRAQQGSSVRIAKDDGTEAGVDEVGRVELRTLAQMRGYWADPERTAEAFTADRWIRTGDLGQIRADGNLVLRGRATDMYIRGGYNVYPIEVENVLSEHPAIAEVAVVGAPAPVIGEEGVAVVVPVDTAATPTIAEIREFVRARIADYKAPDRLLVLDALPRNPTGKVLRPALRSLVTGILEARG